MTVDDRTAPLVSILTPSYNQARWLGDNLRSVASQTYPHIEHVVMDGASSDGSTDVLSAAARPGLIWHSEPDEGQSQALNKAFAASTGAIIGWLNSDDAYFAPDVVTQAVRVLTERPELAGVYGHAALVNADGLILQTIWTPPFNRRLLPLFNFISQPTAFVRRSVLEAGFIDVAFSHVMDRELWLRLTADHALARIDRIVALDRHQPGRKGYLQPDVAREETSHLAQRYGIPDGVWADARRKVVKAMFRWRGMGLCGQVRPPYAFDALSDGRLRLLLRQALVPRSLMPMESRS